MCFDFFGAEYEQPFLRLISVMLSLHLPLPQVIHVANLAACYSNQQVFKGAVKIRKGEAATLMMKATNMEAVKAIFYCYMEEVRWA